MRWKSETQQQMFLRIREQGERRFALLPTKMTDGTVVWLEHYWVYFYGQIMGLHVERRGINREDAKPALRKPPPPPKPTR